MNVTPILGRPSEPDVAAPRNPFDDFTRLRLLTADCLAIARRLTAAQDAGTEEFVLVPAEDYRQQLAEVEELRARLQRWQA